MRAFHVGIAVGALLLAAGSARAAGVYLSDQVGLSTFHGRARDSFGAHAADLRSALGLRVGALALEVWIGGDLPLDDQVAVPEGLPGYGLDAKYVVPIVTSDDVARRTLGVYGKVGVRSVWLGDPSADAGGGRGVEAGVGVLFPGTLWARTGPMRGRGIRLGIWLERSGDWLRVEGRTAAPVGAGPSFGPAAGAAPPATTLDVVVDHWTFGFGFGGDL